MWLLLVLGCWDTDAQIGPHCAIAHDVLVPTDDGATIALHHHPAQGPPVILVHGVSSNHHFWDLDPDHSLAEWLAARGQDVWLLDLRGHGDALFDADGRRQSTGWKIDDYGRYDVAAAVRYVQRCTGYATVGYVGHSMGGMVGAIYAATGGAKNLSSFVLVGSPGAFTRDTPLYALAEATFWAGGATHLWFDTPVVGDAAAELSRGPLAPKLAEKLYNPANLDPPTIERMMHDIVSPMSRGEMRQFARMMHDARFESWDRSVDYLAAMHAVTVPTYIIAGMGDQVAPHAWVEAYGPVMGGPVEVFEAGTVSGLVADYGHLDLGLGERAATEIFPHIGGWLDRFPAGRVSVPPGISPPRDRP
jgi:pimeloyl-ACP methyl ester carboxylesterase